MALKSSGNKWDSIAHGNRITTDPATDGDTGAIRYNTQDNCLEVYNHSKSKWECAGKLVNIDGSGGGAPPTDPSEGDLWWNKEDGRLYVFYDGYWVDASPNCDSGSGGGGAAPIWSRNDSTNNVTTINDGDDLLITGEIVCKGDITAFATSDQRLKENIKPIENAVDKVMSISGNTYDWNDNTDKEGSDTGVIAQEVATLGLPGLVTERDNGTLAVRYEKLVPLLVEAIKELKTEIEELKTGG